MAENTLEGFRWCIAHGVASVELDVRLTRDDRLVCVHDETLAAYGGPATPVSTMTAEEVTGAALTGGVHVPSLEEVLDLAQDGLAVNIEVKNDPREATFDPDRRTATTVAALLDARTSAGIADDVVAVSSFDADSVAAFMATSTSRPDAAALLTQPTRTTRRIVADATAIGVGAVHPHYTSLQSSRAVGRLIDQGLVVRTWTVNARRMAERLVRFGVTTVVTDDPRLVADPS